MRRFVTSGSYLRVRLVLGVIFIVLGISIVVRTIALTGLRLEDIPSFVLGGALVALGVVRVKQFRESARTP